VWAPEPSGRGGEEKNSQPLPGLEPLIIQPVSEHCGTSKIKYTYYGPRRQLLSTVPPTQSQISRFLYKMAVKAIENVLVQLKYFIFH